MSERATFWRTMKAVLWSFFGVRRRTDYEEDVARLHPVHVIVAGLICALLFVGILVMVVKSVVR